MSEATEQLRDDAAVIQVTAMLLGAAQRDDRLAPLLKLAMNIVTENPDTIAVLFASYMTQQNPEPGQMMPSQLVRQQKQSDAKMKSLLSGLEAILKKYEGAK